MAAKFVACRSCPKPRIGYAQKSENVALRELVPEGLELDGRSGLAVPPQQRHHFSEGADPSISPMRLGDHGLDRIREAALYRDGRRS